MGKFFLGEIQSRIYPHMHGKFRRGPTIVSKRGGTDTHIMKLLQVCQVGAYNTANNVPTFSMSGTILPTMCQILVVIQ